MSENELDTEAQMQQTMAVLANRLEERLTHFSREISRDTRRQLDDAIRDMKRTSTAAPQDACEESATLNDLAVQHYYNNELDEAMAKLEKAAKLAPTTVQIWNNLAVVYTAVDHTDQAILAFKKAAELNPEQAEVLNNRGVLALMRGDVETAIAFLEHANEAEPRQIPVLLNLAQAHEALGAQSKAIRMWKLVLAIDPNQEEAKQNLRQYFQ